MDDGELKFSGEIWCWRGPSPFHFVRRAEEVDDGDVLDLRMSVRRRR